MRRLQKLVDYSETLKNYEDEKVKGLHLALHPGQALYLSHRVDNKHGSITSPFWLPRNPNDLRKIAQAINDLADEYENSQF